MANTYSLDLESGSSQYAYISDASQTGLDLTSDFTLECWVKVESQPDESGMRIIVKRDDSWHGYSITYQEYGGTYTLRLSTLRPSSEKVIDYTSASPILPNSTWVHIACSWDVDGNKIIYINGTSVASDSAGGYAPTETATPFMIGANNDGVHAVGMYFDGLIDEVRVWSDVRTSTEISDNYQKELNGDESNLVGYWKFNNSASDETANNNDLTLSGSPSYSTTVPFTGIVGPTNLKTYNTNAKANIKTINTNAIANVKSLNTNT